MASLLSIVMLGFFLGMRHATDPDHVVAVTTIVSGRREPWQAARVGILWGVGHTCTVMAVGAAVILFNLVVPPRVGLGMELTVAVMLVVLGIVNVRHFLARRARFWSRPGGTARAAHPARADQPSVRPLVVGLVHGLAGSAAVTLLVLAAIRDPRWAVAYLLVFGVGTIAGMMLITMGIASAFRCVAHRSEGLSNRLGLACGVASVCFGLLMAYQICLAADVSIAPILRWARP